MDTFFVALRATFVTLILTGILYPFAITGAAQLLFPHRANGSIVVDEAGREVGSELIGQAFADPAYFHPRPSASGYDGANSSGTNLGPTSKKLRDGQPDDLSTKDVDESFVGIKDLAAAYRTENKLAADTDVPADAVTRSASGLDPEISPENAVFQVKRVAATRSISEDRVRTILSQYTDTRDLGFLGEARVNVLAINLALDRQFGRPAHVAGGSATLPR